MGTTSTYFMTHRIVVFVETNLKKNHSNNCGICGNKFKETTIQCATTVFVETLNLLEYHIMFSWYHVSICGNIAVLLTHLNQSMDTGWQHEYNL